MDISEYFIKKKKAVLVDIYFCLSTIHAVYVTVFFFTTMRCFANEMILCASETLNCQWLPRIPQNTVVLGYHLRSSV